MAKIILLNGPSGAGKSTTAKVFLEATAGEWAYISQDDIRSLVKAGFVSINGLPETWSEKARNQLAASIPICTDMANRYQEFGINCIIDCFACPGKELDAWLSALKGTDYEMFVLLPDLDTTLNRNRERSGTARLTDEKIRKNHEVFKISDSSIGTIIDTSKLSVPEVVDKILGKN